VFYWCIQAKSLQVWYIEVHNSVCREADIGGIDDLCLKYFVEAGAMAVRRCKKVDLKRIAKCTGGGCSNLLPLNFL